MSPGYDRPLYLLPFDHRNSYVHELFGVAPPLSTAAADAVRDSKQVIYEGFVAALDAGVPAAESGILVDESFGASILRDARRRDVVTAASTEVSGSDEFDFEYGGTSPRTSTRSTRRSRRRWCASIPGATRRSTRARPSACARCRRPVAAPVVASCSSCWCRRRRTSCRRPAAARSTYDGDARPRLMNAAIAQLQDAGVEPDVWKIEGLADRAHCEEIVATARRGGRDGVACIVLGRGADEAAVRRWLEVAAGVPGFVGFAVGRTSFWDAVVAYHAGHATRADAAARIADRFREWVDIFERGVAARRPAGVAA